MAFESDLIVTKNVLSICCYVPIAASSLTCPFTQRYDMNAKFVLELLHRYLNPLKLHYGQFAMQRHHQLQYMDG